MYGILENDKKVNNLILGLGIVLTLVGVFIAYYVQQKINGLIGITLEDKFELLILIVAWVILFIKLFLVDGVLKTEANLYFLCKVIDMAIISFIASVYNFDPKITLLFVLIILNSGLVGASYYINSTAIISIVSILEISSIYIISSDFSFKTMGTLIYQLINIGLCILAARITYQNLAGRETELKQKEDNISKLISNNRELTNDNAQIKCKLNDLQIRVEKSNKSLAELSTLKEISQVINSTLNIKELFDLVNDVVIGVLGVTYCTIFMKTDEAGKISVQKSNIEDKVYLEVLKEKVALRIFKLAEQGQKILANNIDPFTYPNGIERGIQSAIFVPIANKGRLFGLILAEHTFAKDIENQTKFIEAVANQIGLAIENAMLYNEMQRLATTDALTKVYNRAYFNKYLIEELKKAGESHPLSAIMLDIDHFKIFNDTYGHDFGDEVLKSTAQLVKKNLNTNGMIARFGGEEFIMILKDTPLEEGYRIAENLRKIIEENEVAYNGQSAKVTVSMGVSECPKIANCEKDLVKTADQALYRAKGEGRNCVRKGIPLE